MPENEQPIASRDLAAEDADARKRALDVTRSFLVQAPAGSGKTALLIQRFLALLAHVDRPERIVAMTFTRKAAAEMRDRIVEALRLAAAGAAPHDEHEQRTLELAARALAQDGRRGWQLAAHPARMQILTIDALCAGLVRQAPITARLGAASRFEESPMALYRRAAREALRGAGGRDPEWQNLLVHLDNDAEQTIAQLAGMLARREQWFPELPAGNGGALRERTEEALAAEIRGELAALRAAFPEEIARSLVALEHYAADNLGQVEETRERAESLRACAAAGGLPPATVEALPLWRALAAWLLVSDCTAFRKTIDAKGGFPAKANGAGAAPRAAMKQAMQDALTRLAEARGLARALAVASKLPPARYGEEAWALVASLAKILRVCAAELLLAFDATHTVDFPQLTLAALDALGEADAPNDLLLLFDRRLEHLLVDEFQDTSFSQLELIRRLTAGWQEGDGRTLFAVGDPMQSIYRFRQAEVRFFVEAQRDARVTELAVECLTLRRNFRSRPGLVEWVNATFPQVLGALSDPWRSVIAFAPAAATRDAAPGPAWTLDLVADASAEAVVVVERALAALAAGAQDVAILVRARTHLNLVLPALRAARLPYAAVELDALSERPVVLDLVSLTHAIMQPADRLAWLSVLRAPWCGLTLPDLFALVNVAESEGLATLADLLASARASAALSGDGRKRFARAGEVLSATLAARSRASLAARARGAWLALGGPACIDEVLDLDAAEQFFALLAAHEEAGEVLDWREFSSALAELRAGPAPTGADAFSPAVKVMTLHKAKGLQFDTVILPGLARPIARNDAQLLRWRQRPDGVLLAPMRARGGEKDPLYEYLTLLEREEEDAELGRLLYVGCTRAKESLHLVAALDVKTDAAGERRWTPPPGDSALAKLWPALPISPAPKDAAHPSPQRSPPKLTRLPGAWRLPALSHGAPLRHEVESREPEVAPPFDWARETARHVGTVAHRLCREIAEDGIDAWTLARIGALGRRFAAELAHEGVAAADLDAAVTRVQEALRRLLDDPRGRWLFDAAHRDARSEYALTSDLDGALSDLVLDRTFVDAEGTRWIVDFKFSQHEGAGVDLFLDSEQERYRTKLEQYAEAVRSLDVRPIRLGLYFPLLGGWREWPAP
ncbi:MAG TPA: UvrD-helicase domain-containing protein [Casimicrobiaceae bacterium]|nr:UvrD-helicase domain-containing protein [Casimicrobiaceae bacterium]